MFLAVPRRTRIRSAFRERAKLYHPDVGSDADDERFRTLREAYDVLRDPQRRLQYDAESLAPSASGSGPVSRRLSAVAVQG